MNYESLATPALDSFSTVGHTFSSPYWEASEQSEIRYIYIIFGIFWEYVYIKVHFFTLKSLQGEKTLPTCLGVKQASFAVYLTQTICWFSRRFRDISHLVFFFFFQKHYHDVPYKFYRKSEIVSTLYVYCWKYLYKPLYTILYYCEFINHSVLYDFAW